MTSSEAVDLVVVGAGIVGLAHAVDAVSRGLRVAIVERDERAVGASVRNFGHGCITAQAGRALRYATAARPTWVRLAREAGFPLTAAGTVLVARAEDEYEVLEDFQAERGDQVVLLDVAGVRERVGLDSDVVGGAWFPQDVRVDPRKAAPAIAAWLAAQGVTFHWNTSVHTIEPGVVTTGRGPVRGARIVVAVGHDVDRYFPELAAESGVQRCSLHMLRVADPHGRRIEPAVLTGTSLLRYDGFAVSPALEAVRTRIKAESPVLIDAVVNLMFTQRPAGDLIVGDTHAYSRTASPFSTEDLDDLLLSEIGRLLGADRITVLERWQGIYASAPQPYLVATPVAGVRVVSVTSGIGMTTAFGLAPEVLDDLLT